MAQLYRTLTGSSQKSYNTKDDKPSGGAPVDLSKITTSNTQTGVLNHLSEKQLALLAQFKERIEKDGWWSPDGVNGKPTHDDGTLLYAACPCIEMHSSIWLTITPGGICEPESLMWTAHTVSLPIPRNG